MGQNITNIFTIFDKVHDIYVFWSCSSSDAALHSFYTSTTDWLWRITVFFITLCCEHNKRNEGKNLMHRIESKTKLWLTIPILDHVREITNLFLFCCCLTFNLFDIMQKKINGHYKKENTVYIGLVLQIQHLPWTWCSLCETHPHSDHMCIDTYDQGTWCLIRR